MGVPFLVLFLLFLFLFFSLHRPGFPRLVLAAQQQKIITITLSE